LKKWTVDEAIKFEQPAARFGQDIELKIFLDKDFLREFSGELYYKFELLANKDNDISTKLVPLTGKAYNLKSRIVTVKSQAGEEVKKLKGTIRQNISYAIGYLDALPVDEGESLE